VGKDDRLGTVAFEERVCARDILLTEELRLGLVEYGWPKFAANPIAGLITEPGGQPDKEAVSPNRQLDESARDHKATDE